MTMIMRCDFQAETVFSILRPLVNVTYSPPPPKTYLFFQGSVIWLLCITPKNCWFPVRWEIEEPAGCQQQPDHVYSLAGFELNA